MTQVSDLERDLQLLEAELRKLESEYNMYFSGRLPRPPWETRSRVEALVKRLDRAYIQNFGDRFRFNTLQTRFATFTELWERAMRAREEGRPSPFARRAPAPPKSQDRVVHVTAFRDPLEETEKLHNLYDRLMDARRELGEESIPFHKFVELVKGQVKRLRRGEIEEVAFRVAVKDGRVNFTARGLKGAKEGETS
jgi:hypothetical protein